MRKRRVAAAMATAGAVLAATFLSFSGGSAQATDQPRVQPLAATNVLIKGVGSGRCLAPPTSNLGSVTIQNCGNQLWTTADNGRITINGQCLDAKGNGTSNGTVVTIYPCHGRDNQRWTVNTDGTIRGVQSGRCLDVHGQATAPGSIVELYDCHGGSNQRWQIGGGGNPSEPPTSPPPPPPPGGGPDMTGFATLYDYRFGTGSGRNTSSLSQRFNPYGIAGQTVINNEWQRYQPFNGNNHRITGDRLELTALANLGGVYNGGISSGQITTKDTFYPRNGKRYTFKLRAKVPSKRGAWPAFWMYARQAPNTPSEIDIVEIFDTPTQNTYDWTGYDHGSGVGSNFHNIMTNQWVWHPGFDFAANYHTYTLVWEEGKIYKWVDGTWVKGTNFTWQGSDPQVLINLAMGGSVNNNPNSSSFPAVFSIDSFQVFVDCPGSAVVTTCHTSTG
jgi:hypothetical protein